MMSAQGQLFMAMHWGPEVLGGHGIDGARSIGVNALTSPVYCPDSKQPELKHSAVSVQKADLPWSLLAVAWLPDDSALRTCAALQSHMSQFRFASCVPFGRERTGVVFRAASKRSPGEDTVQALVRLLGLDMPGVLHYADVARGQRRAVQLVAQGDDRVLHTLLMTGDTASGS